MIRLLLLAPTNTISLPLEKAKALLKITKFLMFLLGGFYLKLSGLRKIYLPFKLFSTHFHCFLFRMCLYVFTEK